MYIREYMKSPVITVTPDTLLDDALRTMHQNHIRRLPVVEGNKLVGLVTRHQLREAMPSVSVPLSIWGVHYQLSKMKVRDVMVTDVITIAPEATIEEAAALAEKQKVGTLPVVDNKGELVGIITGTDLLHLLAQVLGFGRKGVRLYVSAAGGTRGALQRQVMGILNEHQVSILSAFSVPLADVQQEGCIVHLDTEKAEDVVRDLKKQGFKVEVREH